MQDCSLTATDLSCRRGERLLFRGLSLTLAAGEAVQVAGANGVGKSSLIRILAGLSAPFSGTVVCNGQPGLIDERTALDPGLPLGKALAFWAGFDRLEGQAREAITDRLGLTNLLDVPVRYLSTGQKKRAAFARLQGQQVPVWLLDEPLNGLDRDGAALVEALAADHCTAGGICVIASHQPFALPGMKQIDLASFAP
jgi:heme exporter protein A